MAKSKPNPIVHETNHVIVTDHGIYLDQAYKPEAFRDPVFVEQLKAGMQQKLANHIQRTARDEIESIRFRMQIAAREFVVPDGSNEWPKLAKCWEGQECYSQGFDVDLGDGRQTYLFRWPRTVGIPQAISVLNLIDHELGADPTERECKLVLAGILAGRCLEAIDHALPAEPHTLVGKKAVEHAKEIRDIKLKKVLEEYASIEKCVRKHLEANPKNTLNYARQLAADELGISKKTVERATKNL